MRMPGALRLFWSAFQSFRADRVPRLGAALAYYTLFALAPVLLVVIAIAGAIFGDDAVRGEIVGQIQGIVGRDGAMAVQDMLEGAARPKEGRLASIVGGMTFLLATTGAFLELQGALNAIWRVRPKPDKGINLFRVIRRRLMSFGIVVTLGFLLMVSLAVSAALSALHTWIGQRMPGFEILLLIANVLISLIVISALFALLFKTLPDVELTWRDVLVGAVVTAILFTIGKQLMAVYLGQSATASTYGAAGSVVILLLWVYYTSQIVLLGAEFTRVHIHQRRGVPAPEKFAEYRPDENPRRQAAA